VWWFLHIRTARAGPLMIATNNRLLIVDDNVAIHGDFRKILAGAPANERLTEAEKALFGAPAVALPEFALTLATQGEDAVALAGAAKAEGRPFALAFVDVRMPPGIDGIETTRRLWEIDPLMQIVICTAHSDHAWADMVRQLGEADRWVVLKKPFDTIEVMQLAAALVQKRSLQEIAGLRQAELEGLVAERTEKLSAALANLERETAERLRAEARQRELERKQEQTQRLESLGVLAGGIAHDFNNLLAAVLCRASLARLPNTSAAEMDDHLGEIEVAAMRAAQLCGQMLAYSGGSYLEREDVDVNILVRDVSARAEAALPPGASLRLSLTPDLPPVRGDANGLSQVVSNLLTNAAEALDGALRELVVSTRLRALAAADLAAMRFFTGAEPGQFLEVEVTDTGKGIAADMIPLVFEPFFTTKFQGRGLGLPVVVGIVRSHRGAVDVASVTGEGSVFRVFLPLITPPAAAPPA
jgi:two-component system NtrC family sensor kinase